MLYQKAYNTAKKTSIFFSIIISGLFAFLFYIFSNQEIKDLIITVLIFFSIPFPLYLFFTRKYRRRKKILAKPFDPNLERLLNTKIKFYHTLTNEDKEEFKKRIQIFLGETLITGIDTEIDDEVKILVAVSALIPVFYFKDWDYDELSEVLIYPSDFDDNFNFNNKQGNILGMVGIGGAMVLSKPSLKHGYKINNDKLNVGIHEFVHKIDEKDGIIDGIPAKMADKKTLQTWREISKREMEKMREGNSDINPYGLTNPAEFFAVVSEYFFEHPSALKSKHKELYDVLNKIYKQDTYNTYKKVIKSIFNTKGKKIGRNSPCPCGSGKKYKKCCLNKKT